MQRVIPVVARRRSPLDRVLADLVALLSQYAAGGEGGSIDLRSRGLTHDDAALLRERLGRGEVVATVDALGETRIHETAHAGLWWLSHCDGEGAVTTETIEVTDCPELLRSPRGDLADAVARLQALTQRS